MSEGKGSSDLQHLMPPEEETTRLIPSTSDVSPPLSPNLGKIMSITPASPTSNNVSSSGAGSVHGTGSHSSKKLGQNMTLSSAGKTGSYVSLHETTKINVSIFETLIIGL